MIVEDIYICDPAQSLKKDYYIVKQSREGELTFKNHHLVVKKSHESSASIYVSDIIIRPVEDRRCIPKEYETLQ